MSTSNIVRVDVAVRCFSREVEDNINALGLEDWGEGVEGSPARGEDWAEDVVFGVELVGERLNSCCRVMCIPVGWVHGLETSKSCAGTGVVHQKSGLADEEKRTSDHSPLASTLSLDCLHPPGHPRTTNPNPNISPTSTLLWLCLHPSPSFSLPDFLDYCVSD